MPKGIFCLIFKKLREILMSTKVLLGDVLVSTGKDESTRQPSGDVITKKKINAKKLYHVNNAPAMMAAAAC